MELSRKHPMMFGVTVALSVAVIMAFALSAWSLYVSHQQACSSRNQTLDALQGVVDIAVTPNPGEKITVEQQRELDAFKANTLARINQARCK